MSYNSIVRYTYAVDSFNRGFHNNPEIKFISENGYVINPQREAICESKKTSQDGSVLIKIIIKNICCRKKECYLCCNVRGWFVGRKTQDSYHYFAHSSAHLFGSKIDSVKYQDGFDFVFMSAIEKYMKLDLCCDECQFEFCKDTEIWINNDLMRDLYTIVKNGEKIEPDEVLLGYAGN